MQTLDLPLNGIRRAPSSETPTELPDGSELLQIHYVTSGHEAAPTLLELKEPLACRAIVANKALESDSPIGDEVLLTLSLLCIPCDEQDGAELAATAWDWVEPGVAVDQRQGLLITLQGARIVWTAGRAAIIASAQRLPALRLALLEFAVNESEVRKIEEAISTNWPHLESDGPYAFHFDDRAAQHREQLAQRFQDVLRLRMRLARVHPVLCRPPVHPPTVASQLSERLKERTRLEDRVEFVSDQLEVYERVYELCGQRSSDYLISRKETTLEWLIIVLLATETIVLLIDLMSSLGQ